MDDQNFVEEAASYGHKSDIVQALKVAFMYISFSQTIDCFLVDISVVYVATIYDKPFGFSLFICLLPENLVK